MDVYGLTGGIGSGKSAVAAMLEEYGIPVVSADELSRMVVAPGSEGLRDVVDAFGDTVLDANGNLDRKQMAQVVFKDPARRKQLEGILHPRIRERYQHVLDALTQAGHDLAFYEVPLLFEKNLEGDMSGVILVSASETNRVSRVRARDNVSEADVRARIAAQMDEDEKRKRASYIVDNDGDLDDLRREVEYMLSRFLKLATSEIGEVSLSEAEIEDAEVAPPPPPAKPNRTGPAPSQPPSEVATLPPPPGGSARAKAGDDA